MRQGLLLYICILMLFSGLAYVASAQEDPGFNFPPSGSSPQARIEFFEAEIQKCQDYLDELSIGINKATILYNDVAGKYAWAGYGWSSQIFRFEREVQIVCHRIKLHRDNIQKQTEKLPPPPSPTPTPIPSPSSPRTETKSDKSTEPPKNEQIGDYNEQIKFIGGYRQELDDLKRSVQKIFNEIDENVKKNSSGQPVPGFTVETGISSGGPVTVTFNTPEGRLLIYLPDDLQAGDTISGTVVAVPNGGTNEDRAQNLIGLTNYQLKVANETIKQPWGQFKCTWVREADKGDPSEGQPPPLIDLIAAIPDGRGIGTIARAQISEVFTESDASPGTASPSMIELPNLGQSGRPSQIRGTFNGDARTTQITIGGQPVTVLAESPRSCLFRSPEQNFGPAEIRVKENDAETKGIFRNLGVRLSAPTTNLQKGERTTVTVTIEGLRGIQQNVPLLLEKRGVVEMEGGDTQTVQIRPADVRADGTFEMKRTLTGLQTGGFGVTATVVNTALRPIIIPLTEDAKVNGYRVRKEGDNLVMYADNVRDPVTGDPVNGQYKVKYSCVSGWTTFKWHDIDLSFKKGASKQKNPCDNKGVGEEGTSKKKQRTAEDVHWQATILLGYIIYKD